MFLLHCLKSFLKYCKRINLFVVETETRCSESRDVVTTLHGIPWSKDVTLENKNILATYTGTGQRCSSSQRDTCTWISLLVGQQLGAPEKNGYRKADHSKISGKEAELVQTCWKRRGGLVDGSTGTPGKRRRGWPRRWLAGV